MGKTLHELILGAENQAAASKAVQDAVARAEAASKLQANAVPVHMRNGRRYFVRISEIPEPLQGKFTEALRGSACPTFEGEGPLAYAWDWDAWIEGRWASR